MAKRKKTTSLPRVTVMAMNRRELLAFTEAVGKLSCIVNDLRILVDELSRSTSKRRRPMQEVSS